MALSLDREAYYRRVKRLYSNWQVSGRVAGGPGGPPPPRAGGGWGAPPREYGALPPAPHPETSAFIYLLVYIAYVPPLPRLSPDPNRRPD